MRLTYRGTPLQWDGARAASWAALAIAWPIVAGMWVWLVVTVWATPAARLPFAGMLAVSIGAGIVGGLRPVHQP